MTLSIASSHIQQAANLSAQTRSCLSLIDGGVQWLQWAILSPTQHFRLPDESQMLCAVQQGLHGQPLCLLPVSGLLVSPAKLMTLGNSDLQTLVSVEAKGADLVDPVLDNQLAALLARHQMIRCTDVLAVQTWLNQLDVGNNPIFQCLSIEDAGVLAALMQSTLSMSSDDAAIPPAPSSEAQAAAGFAVTQARTPVEFADYLQFYQVLDSRGLASKAEQILSQILPEVFGCLECPQLRGLPSPATVVQVVREWYTSSRQLGFARASLVTLRLVQRAGYPGDTAGDVRAALWQFTTGAQVLLSNDTQVTARMDQDGASCSYQLSRGVQRAVLRLDPQGVISLDDFIADTSTTGGAAAVPAANQAPATAPKAQGKAGASPQP